MVVDIPALFQGWVDWQELGVLVSLDLLWGDEYEVGGEADSAHSYLSSVLNSSEKLVIFVVRSDPEPHDAALVHYSKSAIVDTYAH